MNRISSGIVCLSVVVSSPAISAQPTSFGTQFDVQTELPNSANGIVVEKDAGVRSGIGLAVSLSADFNGDGFDDAVIADVGGLVGTTQERVVIILGRCKRTLETINPSATPSPGEVVIESPSDFTASGFGESIAAGDVNNDGFDDLIIGYSAADNFATDGGVTYVIFGRPVDPNSPTDENFIDTTTGELTPDQGVLIYGTQDGERSGSAVAYAGDVNADGIGDILIGSWMYDADLGLRLPALNAGRATCVFGAPNLGATGPISIDDLDGSDGFFVTGNDFNVEAGSSLAGVDLNGDGVNEVVIGAPGTERSGFTPDDNGAAYILIGRAAIGDDGTPPALGNNPFIQRTIRGGDATWRVGDTVAGVGDVNNDGFDDLAVGAPGYDNGFNEAGIVYLIFGSQNVGNTDTFFGVPGEDFTTIIGSQTGSLLGGDNTVALEGINALGSESISAAGDVNGDGFDDLLLGAPGEFRSGTFPTEQRGAAWLIYGSDSIRDQASIRLLDIIAGTSDLGVYFPGFTDTYAQGSIFGIAVSGGGDFDKDGFADLIIGSPPGDNEGAAFIIYGRNDENEFPYLVNGVPQSIFPADDFFLLNPGAEVVIRRDGFTGPLGTTFNNGDQIIPIPFNFNGATITALSGATIGAFNPTSLQNAINGTFNVCPCAQLAGGIDFTDFVINVRGGDALADLQAIDDTIVNVSEGTVESLILGTGSTLNLSGTGVVQDFPQPIQRATVNVSGGRLGGGDGSTLTLRQDAVAQIAGGRHPISLIADAGSTLYISGGEYEETSLITNPGSVTSISRGNQLLFVPNGGEVNISGGTVAPLTFQGFGVLGELNLFVIQLFLNGQPIPLDPGETFTILPSPFGTVRVEAILSTGREFSYDVTLEDFGGLITATRVGQVPECCVAEYRTYDNTYEYGRLVIPRYTQPAQTAGMATFRSKASEGILEGGMMTETNNLTEDDLEGGVQPDGSFFFNLNLMGESGLSSSSSAEDLTTGGVTVLSGGFLLEIDAINYTENYFVGIDLTVQPADTEYDLLGSGDISRVIFEDIFTAEMFLPDPPENTATIPDGDYALSVPDVPPGAGETESLSFAIEFQLIDSCPGDFNNDNTVNSTDVSKFLDDLDDNLKSTDKALPINTFDIFDVRVHLGDISGPCLLE